MGAHLVIAEDDRAVRESVKRALELEGYSVTAVTDGVAALEAASGSDVDLLLLDLGMPNMDGLTVCRRLLRLNHQIGQDIETQRHQPNHRHHRGANSAIDDGSSHQNTSAQLAVRQSLENAARRYQGTDQPQCELVDR